MSRLRRASILTASLAVVAGLGWVDTVTGPDLSVAAFYLLPVVLVAWLVGRGPALLVAFACAVAWLCADLAWHDPYRPAQEFWNASSRLVIFASLGWFAAGLQSERNHLIGINLRLRDLVDREATSARTDALTGLANFQGLHEQLDRELARSRRTGEQIAVAFVDLDGFKEVNDHLGHAAGDKILREVGEALRRSVRAMDLPARVGGDEFVVLLPRADAEAARLVGERIVAAVTALGREHSELEFGASVGVIVTSEAPTSGQDLIRRADAAMYDAKHAGKGQVVVRSTERPAAVIHANR